jgi:hypothetical protein
MASLGNRKKKEHRIGVEFGVAGDVFDQPTIS